MAKSKKSTKPTAVTQEELTKIQELNGNINRILVALGQAEVQKARMLSDYDLQSQELQTTKFGKSGLSKFREFGRALAKIWPRSGRSQKKRSRGTNFSKLRNCVVCSLQIANV